MTIETTEITTIYASMNVLRAALKTAGKEDIRYYLNGVFFDMTSGHVVTTDGHRMLVARLNDGEFSGTESFVAPRALLEAAIKLHGKDDVLRVQLTITRKPDPDRPGVTIQSAPALQLGSISGAPVDGKFPDWRRVLPQKTTGEIGHYNPQYVLDAYEALRTIAGERKGTFTSSLHMNGTGPGIVSNDKTSAIIVVMPMRMDDDKDAAPIVHSILFRETAKEQAMAA